MNGHVLKKRRSLTRLEDRDVIGVALWPGGSTCRAFPSWARSASGPMSAYSVTGPDALMICWNATGGLDCEHLPFERAPINRREKW